MADAGDARDKVIVVIFPDGGRNYLSKLYNDEWMRVNGLLGSPTGATRVADVLRNGHRRRELPPVVLARTTDRVGAAIDLLQLLRHQPAARVRSAEGDAIEGDRRLGQREGPARADLPRPVGRASARSAR